MKDIRNYSTAVQIISGLNDVAIQRLKGLKEVRHDGRVIVASAAGVLIVNAANSICLLATSSAL